MLMCKCSFVLRKNEGVGRKKKGNERETSSNRYISVKVINCLQFPALLLSCSLTLNQSHCSLVPQFPSLQDVNSDAFFSLALQALLIKSVMQS